MKKLLFIIAKFHTVAGEQRSLSLLSSALASQGEFNVTIVGLECERTKFVLDERVCVVLLLEHAKSRVARFLYLLKMIWENKYDLVVGYGVTSRLPLGVLGFLIKPPIVFCERRYPLYGKGYPITTRLKEALGVLLLQHKSVVFQSHAVVKYYKKLRKYAVIPNMLNTENLPPINQWNMRKNTVVNAARFVPDKNQSMLIKAFVAAHTNHPHYNLEIYGDGILREELVKLVNELNATEFISINPISLNLFEHMNTAKIYICSTNMEGEGYSNALLEAMAMGMAPISTNCSGSVEDLIINNENGIIVPVEDVDAMTNALIKMMEVESLTEEIAKRATNVRESNAKEKIIGQWIDFFEEIIAKESKEK